MSICMRQQQTCQRYNMMSMILNGELVSMPPKKQALHNLGLFIHRFSQFGSKNRPNKTTVWQLVPLIYNTVKPVLHAPLIQAGTVAAVVTRRTFSTFLGPTFWCSLQFPTCCALTLLLSPNITEQQFHAVMDACRRMSASEKEQNICFRIFLPRETAILSISAS